MTKKDRQDAIYNWAMTQDKSRLAELLPYFLNDQQLKMVFEDYVEQD